MSEQHPQTERRRRSSAEVSVLVAQYLVSGLRQREFRRQHSLDLSTLKRRVAGRLGSSEGASATRTGLLSS